MVLPVPLRYVAELLKQDGARATGRAVLFASITGFETFEAHIADVASLTGIGEERLARLVAIGRQALNEASHRIREQHLVSRRLLQEFCQPTPKGQRLLGAHALRYGTTKPSGPRGIAKRDHFVKIDSETSERTWGRVEKELPEALAAARTRRILDSQRSLVTLRETVALHFARSLDTLEGQEKLMRQTIEALHARYLRDWPLIEALYYSKHRLYPPMGDQAREEIADDLLAQPRQLVDSGVLFRLRVVDLFEKAREMAGWMGLTILRPRSGEFLIGDVPAIPVNEAHGTFGLSQGVAFGDATMIILPLGPRRLAALTRGPDSFESISGSQVTGLNKLQIANAKTHVAFRLGSGLERLVLRERPPPTEARRPR